MTIPNFFIIGAAKAATTTLSSLLNKHPQASIVKGKEPHFFSMDQIYAVGIDRYMSLYGHCTNEIAVGDASTSYSRIRYHPEVITRIQSHNPMAKIIYMVRHPLERIESAFAERVGTNAQHQASLSQSVRKIPMMVDSSRYWEVFDAYRQAFPEKNIKIVWFEDFISDQETVFGDICDFLGIDRAPDLVAENVQTNSREAKRQQIAAQGKSLDDYVTEWEPEARDYVISQLRDDNLRFLEYFDKPADYWGQLF